MKNILLLALSLVFSSCVYSQRFEDIIKPINISSGETDSIVIMDLYYSDNYNPVFDKNENLSISFVKEKDLLIITPLEFFEGITNIRFTDDDLVKYIPVNVSVKQMQTFSYKPETKPEKVNLFGSFNSWNREELPMKDNDGDGIYEISVPIEPGRYEYKFFVDKKEVVDPQNADKISNGMGDFNSLINVPSRYSGNHSLHLISSERKGSDLIINFYLDNDMREIAFTKANIFCYVDNELLDESNISVGRNSYAVTLSEDMMEGNVTFRTVVSQGGRVTNWQTIKLINGEPAGNNSSQWEDAIIYSLMIDRFNDGDKSNSIPVNHPELKVKTNYNGGDLQGVLDKLNEGYFDSLGVNTLWLSPVIQNTNNAYQEYPAPHRFFTAYHGYWPVHPTNVEEKFGDMPLLKKVIAQAEKKNIKILLDYIANHIHIEHPFWKDHPEWFGSLELPGGRKNLRLWDEQRLTTWFEPYMPSFDYLGSEDARNYMTDNAVWWLKETGAAGFRHDAVKHVPNEFWRELTRKIKKEIELPSSTKVYQIGETFGSYELVSSYVNNGQLDAQFNFNLYDTAIPVFTNPEIPFGFLDDQLKKTFSVYGTGHLMGNVMDSHDKTRFMAYADGDITNDTDPVELGWNNPPVVDNKTSYDKLKLYIAYMMSIPGLPVIYYGDEIGMTGASDPDNRRMMRFGHEVSETEKETMKDVSRIIKIRREHPALRYGDFHTLFVDKDVYAYMRSDLNERIIVVINKSVSETFLDLTFPDYYNIKEIKELDSTQNIPVKNNFVKINLEPLSFKFYRIEI